MRTPNRAFQRLLLAIVACSMMAAEGCRRRHPDYASIGLVEVTGRVTLGKEPLASAYIVFESPENRRAYATTDAGGQYRLNYNSEQTGVMPGVMKVRIYSVPPGEDEIVVEGSPAVEGERVPSQYNTSTNLQVTVDPGRDQHFDFDL